ncbi:MAG TPA: NAD(P)H-dependent oxidoreductase subunit E, partial [Candidatus Hydrogenedentes bacterium]|nr:NAD(P)H-dependent oxidoreductase subunit E [Candidatus Hydrogenedentota bacterium]
MSMVIRSKSDLDKIKQAAQEAEASFSGRTVYVCAGGGCLASGSMKVVEALNKHIDAAGLGNTRVRLVYTGCMGPCVKGPLVVIEDAFYEHVCPEDAVEIVQRHLIGGELVDRLLPKRSDGWPITKRSEIPFFAKQTRVVLRNCGKIDPLSLEDYIRVEGYQALARALTEMDPEKVVEEMKISGLRGRGGAGFPTWMKWNFTRNAPGEVKYVVCNGDEGDPGAFMDRSVLEGDPHSLIEGMAIAAYVIGAKQGYVYVRAEYPLAVERLRRAIEQTREAGLLGENILGSSFSFDLEIRMGS